MRQNCGHTISYSVFNFVLFSLPEDMAFLRNLTKLYVYKNFIEELPEVIYFTLFMNYKFF